MRTYFQAAPDWLLKREGITQRQWRARKRKQLKALDKALTDYRFGCLFTPGHNHIETISQIVSGMRQSHSVKAWGR